MKEKITIKNIKAYLEGTIRYKMLYSPFKSLIRQHIIEQIQFRVRFMNVPCYDNGSCTQCGCSTIALQCASKPCKQPCYPKMMSKSQWNAFKTGASVFSDENGVWQYFPVGRITELPLKSELVNEFAFKNEELWQWKLYIKYEDSDWSKIIHKPQPKSFKPF